jgi:GNAT superfamily N-acetyltransferase
LAIEILRVQPEEAARCYRDWEREALRTLYGFSVVWHEQEHAIAANDGGLTCGVATIRIAASVAQVERVAVAPARRRCGIGRRLLEEGERIANYYNCHKMTVMVPYRSTAQAFFEACGYRVEAVLPQHTFKLDVAVLRKFLL